MKHLRKYRMLGLTALTAGALLFPMSAMATGGAMGTGNELVTIYEGNNGKCSYKVIVGGKNCNLPDFTLPDSSFPGCNLPDISLPEGNTPGTNAPGTDRPETDTPESDRPADSAPESDKPANGTPESDRPADGAPESDKPADNMPENNTPEADSTEHAYISRIVDLVNAERAKEGLPPLTLETDMTAAATVRAGEIQTSFSHTRPNGASFATALREAGVSYNRAGENIAWGQRSPEEVVNAWMNSSGHRANIMNAGFSRIGVGYLTNASGTPYWVQLFAN